MFTEGFYLTVSMEGLGSVYRGTLSYCVHGGTWQCLQRDTILLCSWRDLAVFTEGLYLTVSMEGLGSVYRGTLSYCVHAGTLTTWLCLQKYSNYLAMSTGGLLPFGLQRNSVWLCVQGNSIWLCLRGNSIWLCLQRDSNHLTMCTEALTKSLCSQSASFDGAVSQCESQLTTINSSL